MPKLVIVLPCYNEAKRLDVASLERFARTLENGWVLFVNDGSTDATQEVLERICEQTPHRFQILRLPNNKGKAEAIRQGVLEAFKMNPEYIAMWDADLATPLGEIPRFRKTLDSKPEVQVLMGSRVKLLGHTIERSRVRHLLGRGAATLVSLVLRLGVYDTQCGAKMFRASPSIKTLFEIPFTSSWIFDVEILARFMQIHQSYTVARRGHGIHEMPVKEWIDKDGSKIRLSDYVRSLHELFLIWKKYL